MTEREGYLTSQAGVDATGDTERINEVECGVRGTGNRHDRTLTTNCTPLRAQTGARGTGLMLSRAAPRNE